MTNFLKKVTLFLLLFSLCLTTFPISATAEESKEVINISAPSAILMEANSGTVCYAKDEEAPLPMASVTKVMTMLLIFEAIDNKKITLDQQISISEHAASMGGSQVFLEPGEIQTAETLLKCISIASANDAAVAMAEACAGSEEAFVEQMNQKAKTLHMEHTNFVNCCGLDTENHFSCAKDLAILSRELINNYPQIHDYCKIWQEDITHTTKKGEKPFTLTNTNKLMKQYPYATGLKTGSTSIAKFCLSATAEKDGMRFIAVIMAAPTPKDRFKDATTLLNYGFANTAIYEDVLEDKTYKIKVLKGTKSELTAKAEHNFQFIAMNGENISQIKPKIILKKAVNAPIKKGKEVGQIEYYMGDKKIGSVSLLSENSVPQADYKYYISSLFHQLSLSQRNSGK